MHVLKQMKGRRAFKLLDLFCGEGLAAWGYWLSGRFSEIVGVDLADMSDRYSFDFIQRDALTLDYDFLLQFDFIHASPPCQAYSKMTPDKTKHMRLIAATHLMLTAAGKPYVIENVEGSAKELRPNLVMDGHWVGLPLERRRYFYVSELPKPLRLLRTGEAVKLHGGEFISRADMIEVMGLREINKNRVIHLTREGIEQGIPPAFTRFIAELVVPEKVYIA